MKISFCSTYRIPYRKGGESVRKPLKDLATQYDGIATQNKSANGSARVSIPNEFDAEFEQKLMKIGYKEYQKFEAENLSKDEIDAYIREKLNNFDYIQRGKQKTGRQKVRELYN